MKKSRKSGKRHANKKQSHGRNISPLESHQRTKKKLESPWSAIPNRVSVSWHNECIPNILWACILASFLDRNTYLSLFRSVVINMREKVRGYERSFIGHNFLAALTPEDFDIAFSAILARDDARQLLSALRLIDCLPDRAHWDRHLPEPDRDKDWSILMHSVADCFDHQSERATDVRWLKLIHFVICGRLHLPPDKKLAEELRLYPERGDMRLVRPSVRAGEMSIRVLEFGVEKIEGVVLPADHREAFWNEMKAKTGCILTHEFKRPSRGPELLHKQVVDLFQQVQRHFDTSISTTATDARHDGTFGIVMYALTLLLNSTITYSHCVAEGRLVLRTIVELFITLRFLADKDDASIWKQYRAYGSGQAKLAFLKNLRQEEVPEFFDLNLIESLANEDMWMEFQDINLGNWANMTLRKMSEEAGVKDVYDAFYDWSSGYSHGHWVAVRDAVFVNCMNPLHRFHRIPAPPLVNMPSILRDACKLINRMLDDLNSLYPSFKKRLKWHKQSAAVDRNPVAESPEETRDQAGDTKLADEET